MSGLARVRVRERVCVSHAFVIVCITLSSHIYMYKYGRAIVVRGGYGVLMKKPACVYEHGKSLSMLTFKVSGCTVDRGVSV